MPQPSLPQRIAHRGARLELPENTISAFMRASELGADAVELDVHSTEDGSAIVHHDPAPLAPAGSHGSPRPFREMTLDEVRRLRVGGEPIPTLDEVLLALPAAMTIYVELKGERVERVAIEAMQRCGRPCPIHSFDHEMISRAARIAPDLPRGILFDKGATVDTAFIRAAAAATGARDLWPHHSLVSPRFVDVARSIDARVITWTVNDATLAQHLAGLGVYGLCGDDVRLLADDPARS
ncbi:MAG: glycerophosphoryl diester phosphodiesterase family protein [Gemmatimonadetes bacterium]|nr:glycerophosphoryl diester phosphodiesterase family protein [Gemmatimonadota bacterium]